MRKLCEELNFEFIALTIDLQKLVVKSTYYVFHVYVRMGI